MNTPARTLGILPLAMINIIAIDNLRSLTYGAEMGLSLVTFYLIATVLFFIPVGLVSAVFATFFPRKGGIYVWVSESLGKRWGLIVIWIQWIYNIIWYPTQLTFVAGAIISLFSPERSSSPTLIVPLMLILFWLFTLINSLGMRWSSAVSTLGALGTLLPIVLLISLGIAWYMTPPYNYATAISWQALIPDLNPGSLSYLSGMLFGLIGIEICAYHADEVREPRKTFPRAILLSGVIIFASMVLASLAIALIVPTTDLSIITGILQAFSTVLNRPELSILKPIITLLIVIGGASTVATWIIGPSKGLMVAAQDGLAPRIFRRTNAQGAPTGVLLVQAVVFTVLTCLYTFMPVNVIYMLLGAVTTQLALLIYIIMFIGFLKIYHTMQTSGCYLIPGGRITAYCIASLGILVSMAGIAVGFLLPSNLLGFSHQYYTLMVIGGIIICLLPTVMYTKHTQDSQ